MASPLVSGGWLHATVPIDNPYGESGTGFLVARALSQNESRVFLVTNKHVVCKEPGRRATTPYITCHFNTLNEDGSTGKTSGQIPLRNDDGRVRYREHTDPDTDVCAFDVTDVMVLNPTIQKRWIIYEAFGIEQKRIELDISAGEEIVTIGYPMGLRQGDSNFPLVRQGMIATRIGDRIHDQVADGNGNTRSRNLRAFLFDGATIHGSSGSPVLLKPTTGRLVGNNLMLGESPIVLLGIVAETRFAPINVNGTITPNFAGLGVAFDAETIVETIELFFQS
jgi:hypothetical protein